MLSRIFNGIYDGIRSIFVALLKLATPVTPISIVHFMFRICDY